MIAQAKKRQDALKQRKPIAAVRKKLIALAKPMATPSPSCSATTPRANAGSAPPQASARKSTKGRTLGKVAPKYRNPANPKETWTGRGMQPRWLAALTKKGKKRRASS